MQGKVIIGTELDTKQFDAQIEYIEKRMLEIEEQLKQADMGFEVGDTLKLENEYEKLGNQLLTLKDRQQKYNQSIMQTNNIDFANMKKSINGVGSSISNIIKKMSKWGLAIFGIRSAYLFVRSAMSTLTENDDQLKADIDYIKTSLAYAIEPIVRKIVELAKQLLQLVGFIVYKLTGKNIFAGANKNLKSANKEATKLSKTIAGFDEMNVLNSTSTGGGGGVGDLTPSFNLGDYTEVEKMIGKITQKVKELDDEMERALYHTDFDIWTNAFGEWDVAVYGVSQTIHGLFGQVKSIIGVITSLWHIAHGAITGDTKEIGQGFSDLFKNLKEWLNSTLEIITGVSNTIRGVAKGIIMTVWGWLFDYINKGIAKFNEFKDKVVKVWTEIRDKIKFIIQNIQNWLVAKFGSIGRTIGDVIGGYFKAVINMTLSLIERILNLWLMLLVRI